MPHYTTYGSTLFSAQPADELAGTFNALNETTNFRPTKGESVSIVHPTFKTGYDPGPVGSPVELKSLDVGPVNKTADKGWWTVDGADFRDSELDALNKTTNFDDRGYSPISGEGVFKPQDIDTKGSVIWGDNHFKPGRGGDSLAGEGRSMNSWRNADPSPFEDRMPGDFDANDFHACPNKVKDLAGNFGDAAGNMTETFAGSFGLIRGDLPIEGDPFQPAAGMNSFGESLNPAFEVGISAGHGGSTSMTEQFDALKDNPCVRPCSVSTTY